MSDDSRIYYDDSLKKNADETLETIYFQVYHQTSSDEDKEAFATLLDQYTSRMLSPHIPFGDAGFSLPVAMRWLGNFKGNFRTWEVTLAEMNAHPEIVKDGCEWGARIDRGIDWAPCVYGRTEHDVTILAGVQVLREISYEVLNVAGACN